MVVDVERLCQRFTFKCMPEGHKYKVYTITQALTQCCCSNSHHNVGRKFPKWKFLWGRYHSQKSFQNPPYFSQGFEKYAHHLH